MKVEGEKKVKSQKKKTESSCHLTEKKIQKLN